jgi:uracil-DNA glycosylase
MGEMKKLRAVVTLGRIAHETFIAALKGKRRDYPFSHGGAHAIGGIALFSSYHCSRYNTSTGVLTPQMFRDVFAQVRSYLEADTPGLSAFAT